MSRSLSELIPELDPAAELSHPGRNKSGVAKVSTKKIRQEIEAARKEPVGFASDTVGAKQIDKLEDKLRERWVALYIDVSSQLHFYEGVLGVPNLKKLRGQAQKLIVQTVGAIEERLRDVDMHIDDMWLGSEELPQEDPNAIGLREKKADFELVHDVAALPYQEELRDWVFEVGAALRTELDVIKTIDTLEAGTSKLQIG